MIGTVILIAIPVAFYTIRKINERKWGKCMNNDKLTGQIVIITGANSGIGYEAAKELAKREATVILACRNESSAQEAITKIKSELQLNNVNLDFIELDLASVESIKEFATKVEQKYDKIDILINNAGVAYPKTKEKVVTADNFEIHIGTNYLGHFMLTRQLEPLLLKSGRTRVINVSSILHKKGTVDLNNLNYEVTPSQNPYADSKLLNMYHSWELDRRYNKKGVNVYTVFPGWVYTNLFRHSMKNVLKVMVALPVALLFMRSRKQGAQTIIYCATDKSLENESGKFYRDCTLHELDYKFDDSKTKALWDKTENLLNLT